MPIPQVTDRIKEAPAVALRAVFAGIGQLLMAVDKIRAQMQEQATSSAPGQQRPSAAQPPPGQADGASNVTVLRERATPATKPGTGPGGTKPGAATEARRRDQACRRRRSPLPGRSPPPGPSRPPRRSLPPGQAGRCR